MTEPSIVCLLTPRGRGAVATVAFRGELKALDQTELFNAANGKPISELPIGRLSFGQWGSDPAEDVVVCRTAIDRLEVSSHGGNAAAARVLEHLESTGATQVPWPEYLRMLHGPFHADMTVALTQSPTTRTAAIIAHQAAGPLRETFRRLLAADLQNHKQEILKLLHGLEHWANFGIHLTCAWKIVLFGAPNVGKSSLINALVGFDRAIVFDRPGTTRDVVTAETAYDGWPLHFSDTAGLRDQADELEDAGIRRARAALREADLRVLVLDQSVPANPEIEKELNSYRPDLTVLNKCDLPVGRSETSVSVPAVAVSAKTSAGVESLLKRVTQVLVPKIAPADVAVPVTPRQISAIRAAIAAVESNDHDAFGNVIRTVID